MSQVPGRSAHASKHYRIRRRSDGQWSRGGWRTVADSDYSRKAAWTPDFHKAKIWKRHSDLNSHLTSIQTQCQRYGAAIPTDWEVVTFVVREEETQSFPLESLPLRYQPAP